MADLTTGQILAYWRRLTGISQDELVRCSSVPQSRISRIERDKDRANPEAQESDLLGNESPLTEAS